MKACNQLCPWNTLYGCTKPENEPCILSNIPCEKFELKPQTNADHIRSMTDEDLAEFLYAVDIREGATDTDGWLDFIKQTYGGSDVLE
jgi:hypothetical protein